MKSWKFLSRSPPFTTPLNKMLTVVVILEPEKVFERSPVSAETMQHSWTSEQDVRIKLLKMRSLLKFKSFIDVLHRFFPLRPIPFVRHVSMAIEQRNRRNSSPGFRFVVKKYSRGIDLPVEDWEEALKPLLNLQDKLSKSSKPWPCRVVSLRSCTTFCCT
ncbi:hypothetical protein JOM56_005030 [Amanita muscaria]